MSTAPPGGRAPDAIDPLALVAAALATFLLIGMLGGGARAMVVAASVVGLGLVPLLGAPAVGLTPRDLGLVRPHPLALLGAALIGVTWWYVNLRLTAPVAALLPTTSELPALRTRWVEQVPLAITLLTVGLVPAVCEELACRGLLVAALRRHLPPALVVLGSALVFAALHLSLVRAVPTLLLGALLAMVRLRTGELWSVMVVHLGNNVVALLAMALPGAAWVQWIEGRPDAALLLAIAITGVGAALVHRAPRSQPMR